jgi:acyl-CoA dehydrogenase
MPHSWNLLLDRLYTDARVARIYAGTSEVMNVIIAKSLGL